ncbi:MAG: 50S ribosomal protein L11 methyltransferase [Bacteroidales bacterium]|nr:MAG: 50S ribosomal protein L11 methyltransferase [Bacteroidales bacterium]
MTSGPAAACRESAALNGVEDRMETLCGSVESVAGREFDFILANIGRNIVVDMMPAFAAMLTAGGRCVMSGFLAGDAAAVEAAAAAAGLEREMVEACDGWAIVASRRARGQYKA